jgi:hypothetical protein
MSDTNDKKTDASGFDWSPLGEQFWINAGRDAKGATPEQIRIACCLHRGMTMKASAAAAGYRGTDDAMKKHGSRAAQTVAVRTMIAIAVGEDGGAKVEDFVDRSEARKILSGLARRGDATTKLRACEQLNKMHEQDKERAEEQEDQETEIGCVLELCALVPTGRTAVTALGVWLKKGYTLNNFPAMTLVAPVVAKNYPKEWEWIVSHETDEPWRRHLDECAAGPVLEPQALADALAARIKSEKRISEKRNDPAPSGNGHAAAHQ